MKLLVEVQDHHPVEMVVEGKDSEKKFYIQGLFLEFDTPNRNKRIYRSEHHDSSVQTYINEKVKTGMAWGELDHPDGPVVSLKNASHRIVEMHKNGSNWHGKAILTDTPMGNIAKGLIECGGTLGVSSRGMGNLKSISENIMEVQPGYKILTGGDIVSDPSAHGALVQGIMEGVNYFFDEQNGVWLAEASDKYKKIINKMSIKEIEEKKLKIFESFMLELKKH